MNEKSCEFINQFFAKQSKECFENEYKNLLKKYEKIEKEYRNKILYEKQFDESEFSIFLIDKTNTKKHYKYLLGTLLAYYAIDNVDIKQMVALNDFINTKESSQMSLFDFLHKFGIEINYFVKKSFSVMEQTLEDKKKTR